MEIRILGAHNIETAHTRCASLLIDDILAVDAGSLTATLALEEQERIAAVLLTHKHFDHIRDIPMLAIIRNMQQRSLDIYGSQTVDEALRANLLNDSLYPDFFQKPPDNPSLRFHRLEPGRNYDVAGYTILPFTVYHTRETTGYQIQSQDGKALVYTADTGPGLADCWKTLAPDILLIETTLLNRDEVFARQSGHLTPALLLEEMTAFRAAKGYLPRIVTVHMNPIYEQELQQELDAVAATLGAPIEMSYEGMRLTV